MKKALIILLSLCLINNVNAREIVTLSKCVDGDTAWFNLDEKEIKTRFLAIDTPESTNKIEAYGKEASNFTCDKLTNAKKIEIEYDENSDKTDKYNRDLVWVFVDNELLQNLIIKEGLGEVAYLYGDYKYTNLLQKSQLEAQEKKINIWSTTDYSIQIYMMIGIILLIFILYLFNSNIRKKLNKKIKRKVKKEINKKIDNLF